VHPSSSLDSQRFNGAAVLHGGDLGDGFDALLGVSASMGPPFFTAEISRSSFVRTAGHLRFNGAAVLHGGDLDRRNVR